MRPNPRTIIFLLFMGILGSVLIAILAVQLVRTPPPAGRVDPMRLNLSEFRQLGLIHTANNHYILRIVAKEWFFDVGQPRDTPAPIHIPRGSTVTIIATSMDVVHSLQIADNPMLVIQPGFIAQQTIEFEHAGAYVFKCGNYCGPNHTTMQAQIIVDP